MKRRAAIRDLMIVAGGITILPSCLNQADRPSLALKNIYVNSSDESLIADIASTIIPKTDIPGAREVGSHLFVLKMLDDCYEKEDQQKFIKGLKQLDATAKTRFGNSFINCSSKQKEELLLSVEKNENFLPEIFYFYKIMKEETLRGYMTSKFVLLNIVKYEMIPSMPYNGYYLVKNLKH